MLAFVYFCIPVDLEDETLATLNWAAKQRAALENVMAHPAMRRASDLEMYVDHIKWEPSTNPDVLA